MVKYEVQIRPLNPKLKTTNITNKVTDTFIQKVNHTMNRDFSELNILADMLFYYDECKEGAMPGSSSGGKAYTDQFKRLTADMWEVYTVTNSLKEAKIIAKNLIEVMGIDKVKIAKITPVSSEINFTENE